LELHVAFRTERDTRATAELELLGFDREAARRLEDERGALETKHGPVLGERNGERDGAARAQESNDVAIGLSHDHQALAARELDDLSLGVIRSVWIHETSSFAKRWARWSRGPIVAERFYHSSSSRRSLSVTRADALVFALALNRRRDGHSRC
jgi:hypothetical protein